jgi:hypothetical protein
MYNTENHANRTWTYTQQINTWRVPDTAHAAAWRVYRPWRHVVITISDCCEFWHDNDGWPNKHAHIWQHSIRENNFSYCYRQIPQFDSFPWVGVGNTQIIYRNETHESDNTGCPRRNVPDFGKMFLKLKYTDITQNTYVQSWTVTEIKAREKWSSCGYTYCTWFAWRNTHIRCT